MNKASLENRVAIVTGASSGIGEAIACELARLGAAVVLAARTTEALQRVANRIENSGGQALPVPTDVTDVESVRHLIQQTLQTFGHLDILVNNAGSAAFQTVADSEPETWRRTVDSNLWGTYLCTRFALPTMLERGRGYIINVLSIAAQTVFPASSAYCVAKAGALMFTRVLASEVRSQGIRVTAILPGAVRTPFWDKVKSNLDRSQMIPPERVAEAVAFLLTQPADVVTDEIVIMPPLGVL